MERSLKSDARTESWETWVQFLKFARAVLGSAYITVVPSPQAHL